MNWELKSMTVLILFLLIALSLFSPITSSKSLIILKTSEKSKETTEYWGLCIGPFDYNPGTRNGFVVEATAAKNLLVANGWNKRHIDLLTGDLSEEDIIDGLKWLDRHTDENDIVFLYITSHGGRGHLWLPGKPLYYEKMGQQLNEIECKGMAVIISACHSGSAIPEIEDDGRIIITSCGADEKGGCLSEILNGLTMFGDIVGNNDGYVSVEEAFNYKQNYCDQPTSYHHQISDLYPGELNIVNYNNADYKITESYQLYSTYISEAISNRDGNNYNRVRQSFKPKSSRLAGVMTILGYTEDESTIINIGIYDKSGKCLSEKEFSASSLHPKEEDSGGINLISVYINLPDIDVEPEETYYLVFQQKNIYSSAWWISASQDDTYEDGEYSYTRDGGETWRLDSDAEDLSFIFFEKDIKNNKDIKNCKIHTKLLSISLFEKLIRLFPQLYLFLKENELYANL